MLFVALMDSLMRSSEPRTGGREEEKLLSGSECQHPEELLQSTSRSDVTL